MYRSLSDELSSEERTISTSSGDQLKELMSEMSRWDSQLFDTKPGEAELAAAETGLQTKRSSLQAKRSSDSALMLGPRSSPQTLTSDSAPGNPSAFHNAFNCLASSVRATSTTSKPFLLPSRGRSLLPTRSSFLRSQPPQQQQQQYPSSLARSSSLNPAAGSSTRMVALQQRRTSPDLISDGAPPKTAASSRQGSPFMTSLSPASLAPQQPMAASLQSKFAGNTAAAAPAVSPFQVHTQSHPPKRGPSSKTLQTWAGSTDGSGGPPESAGNAAAAPAVNPFQVHPQGRLPKHAPSSKTLQALAGSTDGSGGLSQSRSNNSDWWLDVTANAVHEQRRRASCSGAGLVANVSTPPKSRRQAR